MLALHWPFVRYQGGIGYEGKARQGKARQGKARERAGGNGPACSTVRNARGGILDWIERAIFFCT